MDISVVIPVYNEAEALPELYRALAEALDRLPQSAEIIFADDGSTDGSAQWLDAIAETDPRVRVLHLSRNYSQTATGGWCSTRHRCTVGPTVECSAEPMLLVCAA